MKDPRPIGFEDPEFGEFYDELPLWSAPFGMLLLERVPMRRGITILDVGAGSGFLTVELAQRCGPESTVIAVDPWQVAMRRLRRKLEYLGIENVRLVERDAAELDVPDGSVDVIVSNLGINNFANVDAVLRVCFRAARSGARLLLTTNLVGHMHELYDAYRATLLDLGFEDRLPHLEAHIHHRATVDSATAQLTAAGFEIARVTTDEFRMRFSDGSSLLRHSFIRLGFLPAWREVTRPDSIDRTLATLERKLDTIAAEHGELALTIPAACLEASKAG